MLHCFDHFFFCWTGRTRFPTQFLFSTCSIPWLDVLLKSYFRFFFKKIFLKDFPGAHWPPIQLEVSSRCGRLGKALNKQLLGYWPMSRSYRFFFKKEARLYSSREYQRRFLGVVCAIVYLTCCIQILENRIERDRACSCALECHQKNV